MAPVLQTQKPRRSRINRPIATQRVHRVPTSHRPECALRPGAILLTLLSHAIIRPPIEKRIEPLGGLHSKGGHRGDNLRRLVAAGTGEGVCPVANIWAP